MNRLTGRLVGLALGLVLVLVLVAQLLTPGLVPSPAGAETRIESSVRASFPDLLTFQVNAEGDSEITKLRLHYKVQRRNLAEVTSEAWPQFLPAKDVSASWTWDMRRGGLPPGASVEYWWTVEDVAGRAATSTPAVVAFDDDRYRWQAMESQVVTLLWYQGSRGFASQLLEAAQQSLDRLSSQIGTKPVGRVRIYIYASAADLRSALLFPQEWTGGVSFGEFNTIAIGVPEASLDWGKRAIAHELSHWLVGLLTFNAYGAFLPVWLDEGLATFGEGEITPESKAWLDRAIAQDKLISVRSLSAPFSAIPEEALTSYAESYSLVAFLVRQYGPDKMRDLLASFRAGSGYDEALRQVYGFDQDGLDALWRASLGVPPRPRASLVPVFDYALAGVA